MPSAVEKVRLGWSAIHYVRPDNLREIVAALSPQRAYVNLEFGDGVHLPDPAHRLEGSGKRLRHIKIKEWTSTTPTSA
ncbi:MAG TPA: DUF1801 domain-containing protein, partial [Chloroflexota bacterium]|nr:DUF1801 domain-containing protein [Chloroflexota bacterium]